MNANELAVADAKIEWVRTSLENAEVGFIDWRDKRSILVFGDVVAVENLNIEGEELDRLETNSSNAFVTRARELADEPDASLTCYDFFVPWKDEPRLRIVCGSFSVRKSQGESIPPA